MRFYNDTQIDELAFELKSNRAIILPTDTVFGIVSLEPNLIYKIKNRSFSKKLIIFINDIHSLNLPKNIEEVITKYWPGKLSIIYKKISYRYPKSSLINKLINIVGPLYSSSANISGAEPIQNHQEATAIFEKNRDLLCVVEGNLRYSMPSTIIDLDKMCIVRDGEIDGNIIIDEINHKYEG